MIFRNARVLPVITHEVPSTSPTLLRLLALPGNEEAWSVFVVTYTPLVDSRCFAAGLQQADTEDIRNQVFSSLVTALRGFRYDPARRFRGYLRRVVENAICTHWRILARRPGWVGTGNDGQAEPPEILSSLGAELDIQIQSRVQAVLRVVDQVRQEVGPEVWTAFWLTAVDGLSGAEAATKLGKTAAAIYMAKSRVLTKLRDAATGDHATNR